MSALEARLHAKGPKRILALDGGGVRGILSLAILERIEHILRQRSANPESFRLCQYFDLIGGTSTGSIIATGLALGLSVEQLLEFYRNVSAKVFKRPPWSVGIFGPRFSRRALAKVLNDVLGDTTLGSERVKTGLAIVTKRADNGSVWILHNNPRGRYYRPEGAQRGTANADLPLSSIVLASTAAPTFFKPEFIKVNDHELGAFIDGGVSPHNDPSLHLLMLANLEGYHLNWPLGADQLMLVSVGTGFFHLQHDVTRLRYTPSAFQAVQALTSMIDDGSRLVQMILQWASETRTPRHFDSEMGDLSKDRLGHELLLHYLRYDGQLEIDWLQAKLHKTFTPRQLDIIRRMDNPLGVEQLLEIGRAIAELHVSAEHFPATFDPSASPAADGSGAGAG